jgi:hypothetical protein
MEQNKYCNPATVLNAIEGTPGSLIDAWELSKLLADSFQRIEQLEHQIKELSSLQFLAKEGPSETLGI